MKEKVFQCIAAAVGAVVGFFTGLPPVLLIMLIIMSLDYATGIICGLMGKSRKTEHGGLSSKAALEGLLRKLMLLAIVALAYLLDWAVMAGAGVEFAAVSSATCLWFIASEGISVVENAADMGVPIPQIIKNALEIMRGKGGEGKPATEHVDVQKLE
ncbi:MAG: phage holin family protein [Clostridia bacterium]|nr:phage holin family protein [Clostridia bacterium]